MTPEKLKLKQATKEMILGNGGVEAAAESCRVGKSTLADYYHPQKPDCFAPLDVIIELETLSRARDGWPHVTTELCRQMGGMFVARPQVAASGASLLQLMAASTQEFADVSTAICAALQDGKFCAKDASKVRGEIAQAMEKLASLDALAATIEQEDH